MRWLCDDGMRLSNVGESQAREGGGVARGELNPCHLGLPLPHHERGTSGGGKYMHEKKGMQAKNEDHEREEFTKWEMFKKKIISLQNGLAGKTYELSYKSTLFSVPLNVSILFTKEEITYKYFALNANDETEKQFPVVNGDFRAAHIKCMFDLDHVHTQFARRSAKVTSSNLAKFAKNATAAAALAGAAYATYNITNKVGDAVKALKIQAENDIKKQGGSRDMSRSAEAAKAEPTNTEKVRNALQTAIQFPATVHTFMSRANRIAEAF